MIVTTKIRSCHSTRICHSHNLIYQLLIHTLAEVDELACPNLKWIGVHFEDFTRYNIPSSLLLELSKNDEKKISTMIQREVQLLCPIFKPLCLSLHDAVFCCDKYIKFSGDCIPAILAHSTRGNVVSQKESRNRRFIPTLLTCKCI